MLKKTNTRFFILILLFPGILKAQVGFHYTAKLPVPDSSCFYKIELSPEILSNTQKDFSDIRIFNAQNKSIPFIKENLTGSEILKSYLSFPEVKTFSLTDSIFVFVNQNQYLIQDLALQIGNTQVIREFNISGSEDLHKWIALKENISLESGAIGNPKTGSNYFEQIISLPISSYKYYKITVNNKGNEPITILRAGIYINNARTIIQYQKLPQEEILKKDSGTLSIVQVRYKESFPIQQIRMHISEPRFFLRRVHLFQYIGNKKEWVQDIILKSGNTLISDFDAKTNILQWQIENEDNPPLQISSIETYQKEQSLLAILEKGIRYQLYFGNKNAKNPKFDLDYFKDSLPDAMPVLVPDSIKQVHIILKPLAQKNSLSIKYIWIVLGLIMLLLGFLTYSLLNTIKK